MKTDRRNSGVTFRAVIISLAFVPLNVFFVVLWETAWGAQYPTTMNIFFNVVFCLLLVTVLNLILRRYAPKTALSQAELLTVYVLLTMTTTVSSHDFTHSIFCTLGVAKWFATPENEWSTLFWRYLPEWMMVTDEKVLRGFFEGESTFHTAVHIKGWLKPMIWWTVFLTTMTYVMLCLNVIVRKQWMEHEKLTYPLVQLPLEMTNDDPSRFFKNRLLWLGFGIAAGIDIINGINYLSPVIPRIPLRYDLGAHMLDKPWNSMGSFLVQFNPYAIGLAFPIPLDLLFSSWFFFLIWKAERVIGAILGVNSTGYPFPDQQILGGYIGISFVAIWLMRKPMVQILRKAAGMKSAVDDSGEPMRYRTAIISGLIAFAILIGMLYQVGIEVWFAVLFFLIYFVVLFSFTRMRAELGTPLHGIHYSGPFQLILAMFGSRRISPQTMTVAAPLWTLTKEIRNSPMPCQLEGFKLAERSGIDMRKLWKMIVAFSFIGVAVTFWVFLVYNYKWGGLRAWRGTSAFSFVERHLTRPSDNDPGFLISTMVGLCVIIINTVMRIRFLWWPLHPLGYPLAGYYHFERLWFPFFISWVIKTIILKYSGIKAYRKAFPFFMGLVLGEFTMGGIWGIAGIVTSSPMYAFRGW